MNEADEPSNGSSYRESLTAFADAVLEGQSNVSAYTNNYMGVHALALHNIFLCVRSQLGETPFAALSNVYVQHFPASQWDINRYGDQFAELLAAQVHGARADAFDWPALAALAAVEYAITAQYYADDDVGHGGEPILVDAASEVSLDRSWVHQLAELHPYADIAVRISFESPVAIWRDGLRIKVMPSEQVFNASGD